MSLAARLALQKAEALLVRRLAELQARLDAEPALWAEFCHLVRALAALGPATAPEASGALLTTAQMAERLGVTPKALLRRKAQKEITPAVESGKLLRWSGGERLPTRRARGRRRTQHAPPG